MSTYGYQRTPFGISVNVGWFAVVAAAFGCALLPSSDGGLRLALLALTVGGFAIYADAAAAGCVAVLAFVLLDGFLVNTGGQLSWHGPADLARLAVLLGVAALGFAVGAAHRQVVALRRYAPVREWLTSDSTKITAPTVAPAIEQPVLCNQSRRADV